MPDEVPTVPKVSEIMSSPVVTASPGDTILQAATTMQQRKVGSLIVADDGRIAGILTERDLVRSSAAGIDLATATVGEWMTPDPDSVEPDVSVQEAFVSLAEHGYRHIPVVEGESVVGIISMRDLMRVAQIQPVVHPSTLEAPPGLEGVIVTETSIGDVRGMEGFYHYRQYSAVDLAEKRRLEDVWYLLFEGELPNREQRQAFLDELRPLQRIPPSVLEVLPEVAKRSKNILEGVRSAVSIVGAAEGYQPWLDISTEERRRNALQICAVMPSLIMSIYRLKEGLEPIEPRDDLGYGANYLYMVDGNEPDPDVARALEQYQMTTIDHGFNASTFTARVVCSTGADVAASVTAAIGALSGPLHGGAPSRALDLLDAIGTIENARPYLIDAVQQGQKIMGFGHRVYKTEDPRSRFLRDVADRIGARKGEFAKQVERTVVDVLAELKPGRNLYANVEFYAGVVMDQCGLPRPLFTPTFTSSRVIGWCANILEQASDNRIIRPSAKYVGPPPPQPVPDPD